jgi:two-component system, LytTR family, response regulator
MIRAVIIDDEVHNRDLLRKLLELNCREVHVVGEAGDTPGGEKVISDLRPDLVFMDVNLGDGGCFDILHHFRPPFFQVIFITGNDLKTIRALELSSLNYIRKPVISTDLLEALRRLPGRIEQAD